MATFAAVLSRHLGVQREILAALSGGLLVLSFPKFGHGGVAFLAVAPLLLAVHGTRPVRALRLGWLTGVVCGIGTLYWTALVVVQYGGLRLPFGIAAMAVLCLALGLFPALFAWMVARWTAALGPLALLAAPVGWVATEVLRGGPPARAHETRRTRPRQSGVRPPPIRRPLSVDGGRRWRHRTTITCQLRHSSRAPWPTATCRGPRDVPERLTPGPKVGPPRLATIV